MVEASRKSAGPGLISWVSAFPALVVSRLAGGLSAPLHSMSQRNVDASSFSAGAEVVLRELAGVTSQESAGLSQSIFTDYRQQLEFSSDHGSETKSVSTPFLTSAHSLSYFVMPPVVHCDFSQFSVLPPADLHPTVEESMVGEQLNMLSYVDYMLAVGLRSANTMGAKAADSADHTHEAIQVGLRAIEHAGGITLKVHMNL